jgi:hypothetical protein
MNPYQPITSFDYFVGKVCTIHTRQINWKLNAEQNIDYFVGIVNSINECGVCLTNVINHKKTFIMTPAIVAIAEETLMEGGREEHEATVKEYEEKKREVFKNNPNVVSAAPSALPEPPAIPPSKPITKVNDSPFVSIASMTAHVKAAKDKFQKK